MSYIRMGQDGSYVNIPFGSQHYIYGNGEDINGWSDEEFAGVVWDATQEIDLSEFDDEYLHALLDAFKDYFGDVEHEYRGGIAQPERAEIFCQCVDRRFDSVELSDELHEMMRESFDRGDYVFECEHCENEFRPITTFSDGPYYCGDDECSRYETAESWGVDVSVVRELDDIIDQEFETDDPERKQELKDEWQRIYEEKVEDE